LGAFQEEGKKAGGITKGRSMGLGDEKKEAK